MNATEARERARQLETAVRDSRREEQRHREAGNRARAELRELRAFCEAAGIKIIND